MKNIIYMLGFAVLFGAGLMSCSVVEGVMGGTEGESTSFGGIIDTLWGMLCAFVPSLAAWEGVGSVFSPRKRKHYTNMVMAVVPLNKNVEFGDALQSLGSGLGLAHSSEATKAVHDEEVSTANIEAAKPAKKA